jgi:hypothetical protein
MIYDIKKESSNFLTKEEAELIINRRQMIIDPSYYNCNCRQYIYELQAKVDELQFKLDCMLREQDDKLKEAEKLINPTL